MEAQNCWSWGELGGGGGGAPPRTWPFTRLSIAQSPGNGRKSEMTPSSTCSSSFAVFHRFISPSPNARSQRRTFQLIMPELLESILLGSTGVPEPLVRMTNSVLYDTGRKVKLPGSSLKTFQTSMRVLVSPRTEPGLSQSLHSTQENLYQRPWACRETAAACKFRHTDCYSTVR